MEASCIFLVMASLLLVGGLSSFVTWVIMVKRERKQKRSVEGLEKCPYHSTCVLEHEEKARLEACKVARMICSNIKKDEEYRMQYGNDRKP